MSTPPPSREKLPVSNGWATMPNTWIKWFTDLANQAAASLVVTWESISKSGSTLADLENRNHSDLQNLNTADNAHLYLSDRDELVGRAVTALHDHETVHIDYPAAYDVGTPDHITTLQELIDHTWSAGVTHNCDLTDNGDGTVGLSAGNAILRPDTDPHSILYNVYVNAQTPLSLTDDSVNYVYLDWNSGAPVFVASTSQAAFNGMDKCIAWVIHRKGIVLHYIDARNINVDNARKAAHLFLDFTRFIHAEGGTAISSPSALTISVTAGHFYFMLNELYHDAFDTSVAGTANVNVFTLWYQDGIGGWTETINQKVVDTTTYDGNTGTPVVLNNNKYGVTWFYIINDAPSELHAVMGQVEYPNFESARVANPPSTIPSIVSALGALIGFVVYEKSATTYDNVYSAFTQMFNPVAATTHNGLAGLQGGTVAEYYHFTSAEYAAKCDIAHSRRISTLRI